MFEKFIKTKKLGGINCLIWKNGQVLFQESYGYKNLVTEAPMTEDTIFRISSMTKPISSLVAMMLGEEKKLSLSDPITKWFPQFKHMKVMVDGQGKYEMAKRDISVLDLLTHRAGFTYSEFQQGKLREDYRNLGGDIDSLLTNEEWINELAKLPLISQPGECFNYGRSTDLLGILISTIEGKPLGKVMEERVFAPLQMEDTFFDVPPNKKARCASNFGYDESGKLVHLSTVPLQMALEERPSDLEFESGGQGLWSTVQDYLKFAQIFAESESDNTVQLVKPETIKAMRTNQLTTFQKEQAKLLGAPLFGEHYGFGLGLAVVTEENSYGSMPCAGSIDSVGWPGAYGGWWSADPRKNAVSIFFTHSMTVPSQLAQGIGFELYEAIDIFSKYSQATI